jgi:hypothetical protein
MEHSLFSQTKMTTIKDLNNILGSLRILTAIKTRNEKIKAVPKIPKKQTHCRVCGSKITEPTPGCKACYQRNWYKIRKHRISTRVKGHCVGCDCKFDTYTPGCRQCSYRKSKAKKSGKI